MLQILVYGYAVLLGLGGLVGYFKASSMASLLMGVGSCLVMSLCGYAMKHGKPIGHVAALSLSVMLCGFFIYRFSLSQQWMPSGMMALASLAMVIALIIKR